MKWRSTSGFAYTAAALSEPFGSEKKNAQEGGSVRRNDALTERYEELRTRALGRYMEGTIWGLVILTTKGIASWAKAWQEYAEDYMPHMPCSAPKLLGDGDKDIYGDGDPHLGLHRVLSGAIECLYPQMLLDPFEEELHMPAAAIEIGNGLCGQDKVVGKEYETHVVFCVVILDSLELGRVILLCIEVLWRHNLVALNPCCFVYPLGIDPLEPEIAFCSNDKESSSRLVDSVKACKIEISPVHDIECAR
jgi:hypothetical protein